MYVLQDSKRHIVVDHGAYHNGVFDFRGHGVLQGLASATRPRLSTVPAMESIHDFVDHYHTTHMCDPYLLERFGTLRCIDPPDPRGLINPFSVTLALRRCFTNLYASL